MNEKSQHPFPIVGIGASAGGLEALQRFLDALPTEFNFALVFIQHLSSKHKSLLQEILSAKRPSLVIQEIFDSLKVQAGRLYLAPPGREVRLRNGLFQTTKHPEGLIHLPIDEFLASLAEDGGEQAIAVIFSGAGTDGTRGCQAVRAAGGTVYVQDPDTAEFNSMPLSAIATGQADAVFSPEDIARELLKIERIGVAAARSLDPITPEEHEAFFRILLDKTGGRFNHYKKNVVTRRIRRRMYLHGATTVKEYLDFVSSRDTEAASLASDLMIGVTSFFRDRVAWKVLNNEVVRKLAAESTDVPVRVWTPASATGEEAYSIAMMLTHELAQAGKKRDILVFATDVNDRALDKAREGKYPVSISADVPRDYLPAYFTSSDDGQALVVNKEIRERVVFAKQDLLTDPPFSRLDLIICRNFMIYLEPQAQEKCITLFHYALKNGGYLFLGNAETVGKKNALFQTVGRKQCRVYLKVETRQTARLPLSVPYAAERIALPATRPAPGTERQLATGFAQEFLLEEYAPAAIAIDQNYDIAYHSGPTNRYLRQPRGVPTQNALELLPETLRNRVRGAIFRATREARTVSIPASFPASGDGDAPEKPRASRRSGKKGAPGSRKRRSTPKTQQDVTLRISKVKENLFVIVFQEKSGPSKKTEVISLDAQHVEETAIHQLESELSATRQDLQSHIEQLRSLNEELQSSNEELQAANEELETSREELQSLNEELVTVNSQLQSKIEEQDETNNDLNNFLASTNIPTMFLDTNFRVKRFTPAMLKLIKLLPSDVGRPIVDMSQENLGPDLTSDAQSVLDNLVSIRKEIAVDGVWYIRATLPYRTSDSRIEGVVITYTDITERKRDEEIKGRLAAVVESADDAIISKDLAGVIQTWNVGAEKIFGYTASEAVGRNISFLVPPGHVDEVPEILKRISAGEHIEHFESLRMRKDGEVIPVSLTYSAIRDASGKVIGVSKVAHDISARLKAEEQIQHLASFPQLNPNPVCEVDPAGNVTFCNPAAFTILADVGTDKGDVALFLPADIEDILAALEKKNEALFYREVSIKDRVFGETVHLAPQFNVVRIYAFDITERKRAEEALQKSEKLFRLAMDNMPDAVAIYDAERRYEFVNAAGLRRVGKPLEFFIGRRIEEMYDEKARSAFWPALMRTYETGASQTVETALTMPTGRYDLIITFVPMLKDGQVYRVLNFTFDITGRKRAEEAILRAKEDWEQTFNTVPDLIALLDCHHKVIRVNKAMADRLGLTQEQCVGAQCYKAVHGAEGPPSFCPHTLTCQDGKEHIAEVHEPLLGGDFLVSTNPLFGEQGQVIGTVHVARNITERKKAEADILRLSENMVARNLELEDKNKELEAFIYSISHDLRAPLRSMSGFSRIMMEDYAKKLDDQGKDYLARIRSGSDKMTHLIDDLLRLSQISRQQMDRMDYDLSDLAKSIVHTLCETSADRNVEVVIAEGVRASVDPNLMRVVMTNLLDNAWKFTGRTEKARVEFGSREKDGKTVYFVKDNGAGFDQQYAYKMFWPFHRLHGDKEFPGTGIGLAIVDRIVRRHGGKVWAEGEVEKGATVFFTLG